MRDGRLSGLDVPGHARAASSDGKARDSRISKSLVDTPIAPTKVLTCPDATRSEGLGPATF